MLPFILPAPVSHTRKIINVYCMLTSTLSAVLQNNVSVSQALKSRFMFVNVFGEHLYHFSVLRLGQSQL